MLQTSIKMFFFFLVNNFNKDVFLMNNFNKDVCVAHIRTYSKMLSVTNSDPKLSIKQRERYKVLE